MELGYTTPVFRPLFGTNNGVAGHVLLEGGTPEQHEYLPRLASGDWTASFALTEAEAGSDPSGMTTSAGRAGGGYVQNGAKPYITDAPVADLFMIFARHGTADRPGRDIPAFLVPAGTPGPTGGARGIKDGPTRRVDSGRSDQRRPGTSSGLAGGAGSEGYRIAMRCLAMAVCRSRPRAWEWRNDWPGKQSPMRSRGAIRHPMANSSSFGA